MSELIISVSGLRGAVGETLTPEVAMRYVCAFAAGLENGPILVTRDGRTTGRMLVDAVRSALCAVGRDVIDADLAATPTTGVLVRQCQAAGGIQVSASHNPAIYNGLKLFSREGRIINAAAGEQVANRYRGTPIAWATYDRVGQVTACADTLSAHANLVLATVDVERIRLKRFQVLLDSNRASGGPLGRRLLADLGCEVTHVGAEPDGRFEHLPEPTCENMAPACAAVPTVGAAVGFFPDPDADRLALADEHGRYIGEEYTLALCLAHVLQQRRGAVVTNVATSRMSQDLAQQFGVPFFRAPVGEANVVEAMLTHDAVLGGEGNGGIIDPRVGYVRDSFVAMALILDALAAADMPLSQLADRLPRYFIEKTKITFDRNKLGRAVDVLRAEFPDAQFDDSVGRRFDWSNKWLLLHPSNTEPIVRIIAESGSAEESAAMCRAAADSLARL